MPPGREMVFFGKKDGAWILVGTARGIRAMD
jgi:hypothetical protein